MCISLPTKSTCLCFFSPLIAWNILGSIRTQNLYKIFTQNVDFRIGFSSSLKWGTRLDKFEKKKKKERVPVQTGGKKAGKLTLFLYLQQSYQIAVNRVQKCSHFSLRKQLGFLQMTA